MMRPFALLGFGEAGQALAGAGGWARAANTFDIKTSHPESRAAMLAAYARLGVTGCDSAAAAARGADLALSLVTADQARAAATSVASHLAPGALYLDFNSVAPQTKRACATAIESGGARYADVAVMAPVHPTLLATPLLISGPEDAAARLTALGFTSVRHLGGEIGQASAVKMVRSIYVKGVEAVTAECLLAAARAGVIEEVIASLGAAARERLGYNIERMASHGARRAAEMREAAALLSDIGATARITKATIAWQSQIGALGASNLDLNALLQLACEAESFQEAAQ